MMKAMKLMMIGLVVVCAAQVGFAVPFEDGDTIFTDYGCTSGGPTDSQGRYWNDISITGTTSNLKKSDGETTDVDFGWPTSNWATGWTTGKDPSVITDYPGFATTDCFGLASGVTAQLRISTLDPNLTYDITVYGSITAAARIMDVTIGGVTQSYDAGLDLANEDKVTFTGITPTLNAGTSKYEILVDFKGVSSNGYLGAIELTAVPEPATMGLLLVGGVAVFLRKRRA